MATRRTKDAADRPYPWEPMLETSVFDAPWKKAAKRAVRTVVPSTPRETANELFLAALGGPLGAGASKVGRPALNAILKHLNPPLNPTRRRTLETLGGKDTLENILKRKELFSGTPRSLRYQTGFTPPAGSIGAGRYSGSQKHGPGGSFGRMMAWGRVAGRTEETKPTAGGVLGDLIEHGNILARKIREESIKEAGEKIPKGTPGQATAKAIDDILKRFNVRRRK